MDIVVVLIVVAVLLGSLLQRTTGMGFAMVAGPFLVVLLDPVAGVVLVNGCGVVSSFIVLARTHAEIRWKRVAVLSAGALIGTIPGALLIIVLPAWGVRVLIGGLIIGALSASLVGSRYLKPMRATPVRSAAAGFASGFMSGSAGVGGPAMSVYAIMTRWDQRSFAATLQPFFIITGSMAVIAKFVIDPGALPVRPIWLWAAIAASMVAGQVAGEYLSRVVPIGIARTAMIALAFGGGILTLVIGLGEMP